jgi:pyridoxamine 5'-phosphate oxidase
VTTEALNSGGGDDLGAMRRSYEERPFGEADLEPDWVSQFANWFADAVEAQIPEPNAMIVSSVGADQRPSARTVLLKAYDERGLVFFTNYQSRKGRELATNPYACLVFPWFAMSRQIVVMGRVERVDRTQTEDYFATRPRESQMGAWASPQSSVVPDRPTLDELYVEVEARFAGVDPIPAPPHWGGLRVRPTSVEFWQGRVGRLHDRLRYVAQPDGRWVVERVAP